MFKLAEDEFHKKNNNFEIFETRSRRGSDIRTAESPASQVTVTVTVIHASCFVHLSLYTCSLIDKILCEDGRDS
jgi:hypothetical protein